LTPLADTMDDATLRRLSILNALEYQPEKLLKGGKSIEELWREAVSRVKHAAYSFGSIDPLTACDDSDNRMAFYSVCTAFGETLDYFMAARRRLGTDTLVLPLELLKLRDIIGAALAELRPLPMATRVIEHHESAPRKKAEQWRGKGTRGLDLDAPRNRLVLRLLDEMEYAQTVWRDDVCNNADVSGAERERLKQELHERIREIVSLPPLSSETAAAYHAVGLAMLKDATGARGTSSFTKHPAFQRSGEFYGLVTSAKAFTGALGEAWKAIAKWRQRTPSR
jgi:hypothetical protein